MRLCLLLIVALLGQPALGGDLEVHFLDVGQGDSVLIVSPDDKTVLIDAGPPEAGPQLVEDLEALGVTRVHLMIGTHPHQDHIGGMRDVLEALPVRFYLDPAFPYPSSSTYRVLLETLRRKKVAVKNARAGRRIDLGGGAVLEVLSPPAEFFEDTRSDANSNSVVARLVYGDISVLFTGDAEQPTEAFVRALPGIRSTVLKVAHHGSAHSTTPGFLSKVKPEAAVICVGDNDFGHPTRQTLRRLETVRARIFRTDQHGTVVLRSDGTKWWFETERGGR